MRPIKAVFAAGDIDGIKEFIPVSQTGSHALSRRQRLPIPTDDFTEAARNWSEQRFPCKNNQYR